MTGPLADVRILDLTRVLAGPTCTQLLGDFGADVIKIERPGIGDDTRKWGPPYLKDAAGKETSESAYYLSANRNKRSVTIDFAQPEGQALVKRLLEKCDLLVENFKGGTLKKYGLAFDQLQPDFPALIYCSISGFGQTGPYAHRAGYDYLAQAMGGLMSITGEPEGEPVKVGIGIADIMAGMYATSAILAALHRRTETGEGQSIDVGLLDSQVAWLTYEGQNYLTSGQLPQRRGNAHPNIVPYQTFAAADGYFVLAVGNDRQFQKFCGFAGCPELAEDPRYRTNSKRIENRQELARILSDVIAQKPIKYWTEGLEKLGVPSGPVNDIQGVFEDPQIRHRAMKIRMPHALRSDPPIDLIGNPVHLSGTPVSYRHPPPVLGQHTDEILADLLDMPEAEREALREKGII
ncbi:MAG: CoA transferase [Alphaproteobacteria bacterium]|nr:CoA transferase [Alphaproteobacteria bacterium]